MYKRNSLYRVRMRKKRRVLRGISMGAKFMVVLVGLVIIFKEKITEVVNSIFTKITNQTKKI